MAIRRSIKLINKLSKGFGVKDLLSYGRLFVYSGVQPTNAESDPSGSHLLTFTKNGDTFTESSKALATIALGGSAGTLDSIMTGGMAFNLLPNPVTFVTSLEVTASLVADSINSKMNPLNISASVSAENVILHAPDWYGAEANGLTFATATGGSLTATSTGSFASGVTALNGINFGETVVNGVLSKAAETWQAAGLGDGVAGWFRFVPSGSEPTGSGADNVRFDGNVGTSNSDLIISATSIVFGSVYSISSGTITEPVE